jgi:hypothetical protein
VRLAQDRSQRRRRALWTAGVLGAVLAIGVPSAVVLINAGRERAAVRSAAEAPIAGEASIDLPSATHVQGTVDYTSDAPITPATGALPPVGGDHDPVVQNCGVYTEAVRNENAVHSLEHGAVWLTYRPDLPQDQVAALSALGADHPYLLVSPYPDLAAPVVASAWGVQVELDSPADARLAAFVARYEQGAQTPEPGAPCSGGIGG